MSINTAIRMTVREGVLVRRVLRAGALVGFSAKGVYSALANRIDNLLKTTEQASNEDTFFHVELGEAKMIRRALRHQYAMTPSKVAIYRALANRVDGLVIAKLAG